MENYKRKIMITFKYILGGEILCGLIKVGISLYDSQHFLEVDFSKFDIGHFVVIILCGTIFNGTLWYLYALMWTYITFAIFNYLKEKISVHVSVNSKLILIVVLLGIEIGGRIWCQSKFDINEWIWLFRSFLLQGIPFMLIGKIIRIYEKNILCLLSIKICLFFLVIAYILALGEYVILKQYLDVYPSTILITVLLFVLALQVKKIRYLKILKWIGKNISAYIYLFHFPIILIVNQERQLNLLGDIKPVIVIIITFIAATIWYYIVSLLSITKVK